MSAADTRRGLQFATTASLVAATGLMIAPTYPMIWGVTGEDGAPATHTTLHSWFSPLLPGYGGFFPFLGAIAIAVAAAISIYQLIVKRPRVQVAIWSGVGVGLVLIGVFIFGLGTLLAWVPVVLALAGAICGWLAAQPALPDRVDAP
ncbi:MAG TPA: hypothetical protein K8V15_00415 [Tessaracoccus flavescens]|uniref:Uncharacterized protein n=1 Tax=Tessaracoccus flavescens TaxID=399497 RepID=A0A921JPE5_9ACTN|nr:hypothetical protein [Tessaracoccus flavescens]